MSALGDVLYAASALALSLALALYLTPIVRRGALDFGVLDRPDGRLKTQREPVPYLGGIAVYLAFLLTLALVFDFEPQLTGVLFGATMVAMLGLFDDLRVLTPRLKLLGQLIAVWLTFKSEIFIQLVAIPWWISVPGTVLWIIGVTNSFNILDVSDGLTSSVAAIASLGFAVIAVLNGNLLIAIAALALAGALAGFLRFNWSPARIYLGDTGSLFVGFTIACLALIGEYTDRHLIGATAPLLILFVPLLETTLVTLTRLSRGRSPLQGSGDHLAIRLKARGWAAPRIAALASALGLGGAAAGIAVTLAPVTIAMSLLVGAGLIFAGLLGWLWVACPSPEQRAA